MHGCVDCFCLRTSWVRIVVVQIWWNVLSEEQLLRGQTPRHHAEMGLCQLPHARIVYVWELVTSSTFLSQDLTLPSGDPQFLDLCKNCGAQKCPELQVRHVGISDAISLRVEIPRKFGIDAHDEQMWFPFTELSRCSFLEESFLAIINILDPGSMNPHQYKPSTNRCSIFSVNNFLPSLGRYIACSSSAWLLRFLANERPRVITYWWMARQFRTAAGKECWAGMQGCQRK